MKYILLNFVLVFAVLNMLALSAPGQTLSELKLEPVSGMLLLEMDDLNRSLTQAGFAELKSPIQFVGSWSSSKWGELPFGASIAQGQSASEGTTRRAQFSVQLLSLFLLPSFQLSENFPQFRWFLSPGVVFGQAQLALTQKPVTETNFGELLKNPHDTNLQRTFFAVLPRAGIELRLGNTLAFRGSAGYLYSFWSTPWIHAAESLAGPPKEFKGFVLEFVLEYKPTPKPQTP